MNYIEDRISSLENRVGDIERHYNLLQVRVNDLEDRVEDHNDDITLLDENLGKMGVDIDRLRCEIRGAEYLDPLTDKPIDQTTDEFVKVVRCKVCKNYHKLGADFGGCDEWGEIYIKEDDYCSRGIR